MGLTINEVQNLMRDICAPWINQLDLSIQSFDAHSAEFLWVAGDDICRVFDADSKIVSGQATMAVADTASFMAICALNGAHTNCQTVDLSTNFMRPLFAGEIRVVLTALSMGRRIVTMRAEFFQNGKMAANATGVFAYA